MLEILGRGTEEGESVNSGLDYWNGLLDWTTGLTFDLKFSPSMGNIAVCREKRE